MYIAEAKAALGNAAMSDAELGERLGGYSQQDISRAKRAPMSDTIAVAIAKAIGIPPGEVLNVARAEREKNPDVQRYLAEWAQASIDGVKLPRVSPEVVLRGGVKVVPRLAGQEWRKRSESSSPQAA